MQKDNAQLLLLAWGMAEKDPNQTDIYNIIRDNFIAKGDALNTALGEFGGVVVEATPLPPLTTETTGGFLGIGEKTRAVPAVVPGVVGTGHRMALPGTNLGAPVGPQLPALRASGAEFDQFVDIRVKAGRPMNDTERAHLTRQGVDPDAVERAAEQRKR